MNPLDHNIAVGVATHQAKSYLRTRDPRHLSLFNAVLDNARSPACTLADTIVRLGRANAQSLGLTSRSIDAAIRERRAAAR